MGVLGRAVVAVGLSLVVAACASTTSVEPHTRIQDRGQGRLYFLRESTVVAAVTAPDIKVNGEKVGTLATGSFFFIDRPPGKYEIAVEHFLDLGRFVADVTVMPGATYYFEIGPNPNKGAALPVLAGNIGESLPAREATGYFLINVLDQPSGRQIIAKLKG